MSSSPNTFALPEGMKRPGAGSVAACSAPALTRSLAAWALLGGCVFTWCLGFAFEPYPERMAAGLLQVLAAHSFVFLALAFVSLITAITVALVALIGGRLRRFHTLVLLCCFLLPPVFLLLGGFIKSFFPLSYAV